MFRVIQSTAKKSAGSVASLTSTAIATTTGNNLIACLTCFGDHIGTTPMTDSQTSTWAAGKAKQGTTKGWTAVFHALNITGSGSHTVTFTTSGANDFIAIVLYEVEGIDITSPVNHTNFASASSTTHSSGSIAADSGVDEIAICIGALSASAEGSPTITTPETEWAGQASAATATTEGYVASVAYLPVGASATFTYTTSNTQFETAMIVGYKSAPGGGVSGGSWAAAYPK